MRVVLLLLVVGIAGCAVAPGPQAPRQCPLLPEMPPKATAEQKTNHYAVVIRLYAQCAGVPAGDQ